MFNKQQEMLLLFRYIQLLMLLEDLSKISTTSNKHRIPSLKIWISFKMLSDKLKKQFKYLLIDIHWAKEQQLVQIILVAFNLLKELTTPMFQFLISLLWAILLMLWSCTRLMKMHSLLPISIKRQICWEMVRRSTSLCRNCNSLLKENRIS